jgi:hypothetical protein
MIRTGLLGQALCAILLLAIKKVAKSAAVDWTASRFEELNKYIIDFLEDLKEKQSFPRMPSRRERPVPPAPGLQNSNRRASCLH